VITGGPAAGKTGIVIERLVDLMASEPGRAVDADRLLIMTSSADSARAFESRLRRAVVAERESEPVAGRQRRLLAIEADLDHALIVGGDEIAPALLAQIGRCLGDPLLEILHNDADARHTLGSLFDHVVVDEVDCAADDAAIDRVDIALVIAEPSAVSIAGEAAHEIEIGGECLMVELGGRGPLAAGRDAASAADLVADLVERVRRERLDWTEIAIVTADPSELGSLIAELDAAGVPVDDRCGSLLQIPQIRQIVLAIAAIADPGDPVAIAALLSPPMFALEVADRWAVAEGAADPVTRARLAQAESVIAELRFRRHQRTAGETARALVADSGCARALAVGPCGDRWLARLARLCEVIDELAEDGDDFDAVAMTLRGWVDVPPAIDCPPANGGAVWLGDPRDLRGSPEAIYAWFATDTEIDRARRRAGRAVVCHPPHGFEAIEARGPEVALEPTELVDGQRLADVVARAWERVEASVRSTFLPPMTVAELAARRCGAAEPPVRFDSRFEGTVRRALQICLGNGATPASAVTAAAVETGLETYLGEATEDVERALECLDQIGVSSAVARVGYPVAGVGPGGELLAGEVDIAAARDSEMWLIDVVCGAAPFDDRELPRDRIDRLRIAATLMQNSQTFPLAARCGLLYTASGSIAEVSPVRRPSPSLARPG
jgi:hypothetical protein